MSYEMTPKGVCSSKICFDLNDNVVTNVVFTNGCNGNLKAICKVIDGMTVEQIEGYFIGNLCGRTLPARISWPGWCGRLMRSQSRPDERPTVDTKAVKV